MSYGIEQKYIKNKKKKKNNIKKEGIHKKS